MKLHSSKSWVPFFLVQYFLFYLVSCTTKSSLPTLTTLPVSSILANQALSGGKIISNGSDIVVERGVVVSTKPNPMVDLGDKTIDASGTGEFVILVKNLNPNTTYYIKAYAINSVGTAYGNEIQFSTNDVNLTRGLVAYYPFSGTAFDSSGNGNSGIVNGATFISNRFGLPNSALSFDGINDNVQIPNTTSLNPTSISISGWFKAKENPQNEEGGAKAIISKWFQQINCDGNGDNFTIQLSKLNNLNVFAAATSKNNSLLTAIRTEFTPVLLDKWVHFVFIHDELIGQKLFLNGTLVSQNSVKGPLCKTSNPIYIGADLNSTSSLWRYMNGIIDDIRIHNRSLNQEEIAYMAKN